eukprot:CAMPEP_0118950928 /NCGR_PEP_ID=MMETSP1169-20130426/52234_1 /TAXON_ID=36882 /ORGANISM="Pyramimonas obovata, Strain CCMP722" /LENGTH=30 /DNA_ID= /DNA_START= /DNA_END= /DNA_ORIENTATION=
MEQGATRRAGALYVPPARAGATRPTPATHL